MRKDEYIDFSYTGNVQQFIIPNTGVYKLEVWGGSGAYGFSSAKDLTKMKGGYAIGYKKLKKGTILYICVGGKAISTNSDGQIGNQGYNGGGKGLFGHMYGPYGNWGYSGAGGGATHIALVDGTLANIGKSVFDTKGLIVAGGGSGSCHYRSNGNDNTVSLGDLGGNQTATGTFGKGTEATGYCGNSGTYMTATGGGGYYGGNAGKGGSSWIDGVDDFKDLTKSMIQGGNDSGADGKARITLIQSSNKYYGTKNIVDYLGNIELEKHFGNLDM